MKEEQEEQGPNERKGKEEMPKTTPAGFGKGVNDYLNHNVTVADAKAAGILATNFVLLGGLSNFCYCPCTKIYYLVVGIFSIGSILLCATVLFPRLPKSEKGLIFWENIKSHSSINEYINESGQLNNSVIEEEYAKQNWHVSQVLSKKHFFIRLAIIAFAISLISLVVMFIKFS